ncbi:precorrin-3B synthase [Roseobacter sp. A03A-229]
MIPEPTVKGWCPGAYRPMMSGDGLIIRVRPFFARLDREQVLGLCTVAETFGNGFIDLTNRANLQIRGIAEGDHDRVLQALHALGLLDEDPEIEARRNMLVTPFWGQDDDSYQIILLLLDALPQLPELPAKFGFAVDTGAVPLLQTASADIRIERADEGFLLRADGSGRGRLVQRSEVQNAVIELAEWFTRHRAADERRMAQTVQRAGLAASWTTITKPSGGLRPKPGHHALGALVGAAFGQLEAGALKQVMTDTSATGLRVTPWRMILLEGTERVTAPDLISSDNSPLLTAQACPGTPFCTTATVETRALARALASQIGGSVHVSGCAKSCASKQSADVTLIGRDGRFDLVRNGHAWDAPQKTGLRPDEILTELKTPA